MTNFERIKNMNLEELAKSCILDCDCCTYHKSCTGDFCCENGIKEWLESEVE